MFETANSYRGWIDNSLSDDAGGLITVRVGKIQRVPFRWSDSRLDRSRCHFSDVEFELEEDSRGRLRAVNVRPAVAKEERQAKLTTGLHDRIERITGGNHANV
jgi:hypothetical protein